MRNSFTVKYLFLFVVLLMSACTSSLQQQYKDEANAICKLYAPERWADKEGTSALDNFAKINGEIRAVAKSEAFAEIFNHLAKTNYKDFYKALKPEVSQLIGEEWQCDNAKDFYAIKWERKVEVTQPVTEGDVVITMIDKSFVTIVDKKVIYTDVNAMKSALQKTAVSNRKIVLKVPESHTQQEIDKLLVPFKELGVKNLAVVIY